VLDEGVVTTPRLDQGARRFVPGFCVRLAERAEFRVSVVGMTAPESSSDGKQTIQLLNPGSFESPVPITLD
jgi:hypothetical protein